MAAQPQGEEGQASIVGIPPPMSGPSGGAPVLQEWIADAPLGSTPVPNVSEQRPMPSFQAQSSTRTQPPCKEKGAKPSGGKSRGIPKLPPNAPPLNSSVKAWREFINKEQRHHHWGEDEVSPVEGASHPWDAYLTANGVSAYDADDMLQWARQASQEYVNSIIANGGENNPQVMAKIEPLREALTKPCPPSDVRSREWYEHQAQAIGYGLMISRSSPHLPLQHLSKTFPTVLVGEHPLSGETPLLKTLSLRRVK
ncbi:hypothetical protein F5J12DRAFT_787555 [Pisolithus orientalis]|uniref:uncharacterized protein n=1 Tax=Pisolithus orientalis TaxID=936130 RepID=UPI0022245F28|nr:uncharacterized protein F5J12DRAFT_787555 [Pisolithus orientalis]KAI5984552.1 hypothetical protein F5J12DRAFT_787555 [Pisolithus orientalis]